MMETIRRRLARLETEKPDPMNICDVHYATDEQLETYIIASDIERRKVGQALPAIEYRSGRCLGTFLRRTVRAGMDERRSVDPG